MPPQVNLSCCVAYNYDNKNIIFNIDIIQISDVIQITMVYVGKL